ncbi:MAG: GxxExxY protein [Rhodospirillales bacterium]|nr:GxxExxY protein [Rhodospirillales bacterium]
MEPPRHQDTKEQGAIPDAFNALAHSLVDSAFAVHSTLGAGLLESVYEQCLIHELSLRNLRVARQIPVPVVYKEMPIEIGFRLDLLLEDSIIVEIKAVDRLMPVHDAQILTYLKLTGKRLGFLINFNVPRIKDGIRRFVL